MEREFDSRSLLKGLYDFKTCSRNSDGSFYGTADSNQCRVGTEVSMADLKEMMNQRGKKVEADHQKVLSGSFSGDLAVTPASSKNIAKAKSAIDERKAELEKQLMDPKADVSKTIDRFTNDREFMGDHMTAKTIVVGMEDAIPKEAKTTEGYAKFMAEKIAKNEFKQDNPELRTAADYSTENSDKKAPFHDRHTKILTSMGNDVYSPADMVTPGGAIAQLELRSIPAAGIKAEQWSMGNLPAVANNPELNARMGTRDAYERNYDRQMTSNVKTKILEAARGNPNLDTVVMSMGGAGRTTSNSIVYELSQEKGARYREFQYSPDGKTTKTGRIVDPTGKGKPLLYDYGSSTSAREFQGDAAMRRTGNVFREQSARLLNNETSSTSSLRRTVTEDNLRERIRIAKAEGRDADAKALRKSLREL